MAEERGTGMAAVTIRALDSPAEFRLLARAEASIWGPEEAIPYHQTLVAVRCGGVALGAFAGADLVGFVYGFPAWDGRRVWLHSHILGVLPAHRGSGLGARLKWAQRQYALARGYDLITWTYDPLEATNAHLNLHRLGGVARRFLPNYYGTMSDALNAGLPSDRLWLEWHLGGERVARLARAGAAPGTGDEPDASPPAAAPDQPPAALAVDRTTGPWPTPLPFRPGDAAGPVLAIPVPWGFQELKRQDPSLARRWREEAGRALQHCLETGYEAVDFAAPPAERRPGGLGHYRLRKDV